MSTLSSEIIIVSYNTKRLLKNCLDSILSSELKYTPRITVVDNSSTDGSQEMLQKEYPKIKLIALEQNIGYGSAMNKGIQESRADVLFLCNSDLYFHKDTIESTLTFFESNNNIGLMGAQLIYPNGDWQASFYDLPSIKSAFKKLLFLPTIERMMRKFYWNHHKFDHNPKQVEHLNGAFIAAEGNTLKELGGFDEDYFFYSEDQDLCKRFIKKGKAVIFNPKIELTHVQGASSDDHTVNSNNIKLLVEGLKIYSSKHMNGIQKAIYLLAEKLNNFLLLMICNLLSMIDSKFKNKAEYYSMFLKELKHFNKTTHPARQIPVSSE